MHWGVELTLTIGPRLQHCIMPSAHLKDVLVLAGRPYILRGVPWAGNAGPDIGNATINSFWRLFLTRRAFPRYGYGLENFSVSFKRAISSPTADGGRMVLGSPQWAPLHVAQCIAARACTKAGTRLYTQRTIFSPPARSSEPLALPSSLAIIG